MTFNKRFGHLTRFVICIVLIFFKNVLQDYLFQYLDVPSWERMGKSLFYAGFETVDWILFWYFFRTSLDKLWKLILMCLITVIFTTIPDFLYTPVWNMDHDNLIIKSFLYFVPFLIFLFLKKSLAQIFLPVMMAFIPLVNLEIANGFEGNLSLLKIFFGYDFLDIAVGGGIFLDLGLALVKSLFWAAFAILFFEINHQFFVLKSWHLFVEMPLRKGNLLLVFLVFKTLIYWLLGSLIIVLLGQYSIPLFTNKVGMGLHAIGYAGYLAISTLYFRKYMTMYFYDKCGHSNWLYPFFFLPFVDIIALGVFLILQTRHIKRFFRLNYTKERLVFLVCLILLGYAVWAYFSKIRILPENQQSLKNALLFAQVILPILSGIGIFLSLKSKWFFRSLLLFLVFLFPVFYYYISANPSLGNFLKVEQLVNIVSVYLNITVAVVFLYPVLNFKSFLKLQ